MKLILIPTPIGNLKDITLRAIECIEAVDVLIVEDTRVTKKLLQHYSIDKQMISNNNFNEHGKLHYILTKIKQGQVAGLISDAGTPQISDPGFLLVRECIKENILVESLPGATALVTALVQSGLPCNRFVFEGFLPVKKGRKKILFELINETRTMVFYESPLRVSKTIEDFIKTFGADRRISIHRELTKKFEEVLRGTLSEMQSLKEKKWKGEITLVVEGKEPN